MLPSLDIKWVIGDGSLSPVWVTRWQGDSKAVRKLGNRRGPVKITKILFALTAFLAMSGIAAADTITYTEGFNFGTQTAGWNISGSQTATINFDIINLGNQSTLTLASKSASPDASGFILGSTVSSAIVGLTFYDEDSSKETVTVKATSAEGGVTLASLNNSYGAKNGQGLTIDLSTIMYNGQTYSQYLQNNGKFSLIVQTPNDIYLTGASLQVVDSRAVPEPPTLMLLGTGLIGLAFWGRRKFKARN